MAADKNQVLAEQLLELLGGPGNIAEVTNCITRMRVKTRNPALIQEDAIKATPGVLGVVDDETYQVILGPGTVTKVTDRFQQLVGSSGSAAPAAGEPGGDVMSAGQDLKADIKKKNETPVKLFLRKIANIFVPLIPALVAAGLITGIKGILENMVSQGSATWATDLVPVLGVIGGAFFSYLAVFAGINAAKEFGGTPALGGAVAAIIVFPAVGDLSYTLPGIGLVELEPGMGGVIGAIFAAGLCAWIERKVRGKVPDAIDILVTPTVALLVSGLATIYVFMLVAGWISQLIGDLAVNLLETSGLLAGPILAGLFLPLVMLGLHQALIPIHTTLIETDGYTILLPILAMAGAGQVGAAIAVYQKLTNNAQMRNIVKGTLPVGFMGVGEPLIYGVSLPLGRPFITACLGGSVGGLVLGGAAQFAEPVGSVAIGPSGLALIPLVTSPAGAAYAVTVYVLGLVAGYIGGYLITTFFGFTPELMAEHNHPEKAFEVPHPDDAHPIQTAPGATG